MSDKIYISWDDALAAVKFKGSWRFFFDMEVMFLLDYSSYDHTYSPLPGQSRYGTLVVDETNAAKWMESLSGELTLEQLPNTYWQDTEARVLPTFVIDFDKKLWVGGGWKMDQSPLHEYQPQDWTALEGNVMEYVPDEIKSYFE